MKDQKGNAETLLAGHIRFQLDIQPQNMEEFCSIMQMIVDKMSSVNADVTACDLKLAPVPPKGEEKMASLAITASEKQYQGKSRSSRWDNAFLNAFDQCNRQLEASGGLN